MWGVSSLPLSYPLFCLVAEDIQLVRRSFSSKIIHYLKVRFRRFRRRAAAIQRGTVVDVEFQNIVIVENNEADVKPPKKSFYKLLIGSIVHERSSEIFPKKVFQES